MRPAAGFWSPLDLGFCSPVVGLAGLAMLDLGVWGVFCFRGEGMPRLEGRGKVALLTRAGEGRTSPRPRDVDVVGFLSL